MRYNRKDFQKTKKDYAEIQKIIDYMVFNRLDISDRDFFDDLCDENDYLERKLWSYKLRGFN